MISTLRNDTPAGETVDKATCGICRRQVSRYTCPSCNVPYCSLTCFRSNEHTQCSEAFYKHELESEIRTQPSASMEERRRMMNMLKKFEEEGGIEGTLGDEDGGDDSDDLAERLGNIDIDSASASDIWNALTSAERESFLSKIRDPTSVSAQELIRNAGIESSFVLPWWEAPEVLEDEGDSQDRGAKEYGKRPNVEQIPEPLLHRPARLDSGPPLLYNICSVFIAYAYVTRHLGTSPLCEAADDDKTSARHLIRELVPFLVEKHSTALFHSMDDVVSEMWPRLVDENKADRASFVAVLRDSARLLTPRRVALVNATTSSSSGNFEEAPQRDALLVLSDLTALFKFRSGQVKETPASHKLRFYTAQIASLPTQLLAAFSAEVAARARSVEMEGESDVRGSETYFQPVSEVATSVEGQKGEKRPVIEEI